MENNLDNDYKRPNLSNKEYNETLLIAFVRF